MAWLEEQVETARSPCQLSLLRSLRRCLPSRPFHLLTALCQRLDHRPSRSEIHQKSIPSHLNRHPTRNDISEGLSLPRSLIIRPVHLTSQEQRVGHLCIINNHRQGLCRRCPHRPRILLATRQSVANPHLSPSRRLNHPHMRILYPHQPLTATTVGRNGLSTHLASPALKTVLAPQWEVTEVQVW